MKNTSQGIENVVKETGREGATNTDPALDIRHWNGASDMPDNVGNIGLAESASKNTHQWKSIGELARRLAEKAGGK